MKQILMTLGIILGIVLILISHEMSYQEEVELQEYNCSQYKMYCDE